MSEHFVIHCDGGARGNPGPAGIGVAIYKNDVCIKDIAEYLGEATNNQAEYQAVITALEAIKNLRGQGSTVEFILDSELVVEQLAGRYRVKNAQLKPLYDRIQSLIHDLGDNITFRAVPREENAYADKLVNKAIDAALQRRMKNLKIEN